MPQVTPTVLMKRLGGAGRFQAQLGTPGEAEVSVGAGPPPVWHWSWQLPPEEALETFVLVQQFLIRNTESWNSLDTGKLLFATILHGFNRFCPCNSQILAQIL